MDLKGDRKRHVMSYTRVAFEMTDNSTRDRLDRLQLLKVYVP